MTASAAGERTGDYATRPGTREDLPGILSLLRLTLSDAGVTAKTPAFWDWKHDRSPSGPSVVSLACDPMTGEIVGLRAMMRWQLRDEAGTVLAAVRPVDTATHPGWQKKGIFRRLTLDAIERLADGPTRIVFNTPNATSMPAYLKLGWSIVCRQTIRLRPARPDRLLVELLSRRPPTQSGTWRRNGGRIEIGPLDSLLPDERSDLFAFCEAAEAQRAPQGLRTNRSAAFVEWRYSHPSAAYHVMRVHTGEQLTGAVFFRHEYRLGIRGVMLADFFASDAMPVSNLLGYAIRAVHAGFYVASGSAGTAEDAHLISKFFLPVRRMSVAARAIDPSTSADIEERLAKWDLALSDLEIF